MGQVTTPTQSPISKRLLAAFLLSFLALAALATRALGDNPETIALALSILGLAFLVIQHLVMQKYLLVKSRADEEVINRQNLKNQQLDDHLYALEDELSRSKDVLVQTEKMASLGAMSAGVAHEINNPVGFMMSNMCTLKEYLFFLDQLTKQLLGLKERLNKHEQINHEDTLKEIEATLKIEDLDFVLGDANTLIDESLTGGARIKEITNSMKGYVRDSTEEQVVLVNDMIEQTLNIVWNQIKYNCTLDKQLGKCDQVKLSPSAFNQVLLNIMINASHAMEDIAGTLTLITYQESNMVITKIKDTGTGIAPENLSKIFDPFFTTKPVGQGTGLGMSISYDIIKGFGGTIDVDSTVGEGTCFTISLPTHNSDEEQISDT